MSVRRIDRKKEPIPLASLGERLPAMLAEIQKDLFDAAVKFRDESTVFAKDVAELEAHFAEKRGFVAMAWSDDAKLEAEIKARTMATLRCVPLDQSKFQDAADGRPWALFARSY